MESFACVSWSNAKELQLIGNSIIVAEDVIFGNNLIVSIPCLSPRNFIEREREIYLVLKVKMGT